MRRSRTWVATAVLFTGSLSGCATRGEFTDRTVPYGTSTPTNKGTAAGAPVLSSSVVYAEVSDEQLMDQVLKIKRMLADLEESLEAKKMPTDATRREKMMPMLNEIERILKEAHAYGSN